MFNTINDFRSKHGVHHAKFGNNLDGYYCLLHCLEMSRKHEVIHTPDYYLADWSQEAVAIVHYCNDWKNAVINELASSDNHRNMLLTCDTLVCADYIYNHNVYVTIRGK
jgi:hypothetical protein